MKKVSVIDRYTYDGKEMSEREREIYLIGMKDGEIHWFLILMIIGMGISVGRFLCQFLNH